MADTSEYTSEDVGCFADSARGIYAIDKIVAIATAHGMADPATNCKDCAHYGKECERETDGSWSMCEWAGDIEDACDEHMNSEHGADGCYWGRTESADWGLWRSPCEHDTDPDQCEQCERERDSIRAEGMLCSVCRGSLVLLDSLGYLTWYRCQSCGVDQYRERERVAS